MSSHSCKMSLEWLLVCLHPSECIHYVEQGLVFTLPFLFMVECSELRATTPAELSGEVLFWRPLGKELSRDKFSNSSPVVSGLPGKPGVIIVSYRLT